MQDISFAITWLLATGMEPLYGILAASTQSALFSALPLHPEKGKEALIFSCFVRL
jgi:hypothetical protein